MPEEEGAIIAVEPSEEILQPVRGDEPLDLDDFFPPIDLTKDEEEKIKGAFTGNLKRCITFVNQHIDTWDRWQRIYELEYAHDLYSDIGGRATFPAGLLCEKVITATQHLMRAIYAPDPLFAVHEMRSEVHDIDSILRVEHWMDGYCRDILKLKKRFGKEALLDFLLFGSMICEVDNIYKVVPSRTIKTIRTVEELKDYEHLITDESIIQDKFEQLAEGGKPVKLIVEQENIQERGLTIFITDLVDHLIQPGVFRDEDMRFRAKRMYYTESDLRVLASSSVRRFKEDDIAKVFGQRAIDLNALERKKEPERLEEMRADAGIAPGYEWLTETSEWGDKKTSPYKDVYVIFKIFAKYAYKTRRDPRGLIPKWTVWEYDPVSETILRARTYPHFDERLPWIHFCLGRSKRSYYGFGYGALLEREDSRQTSIMNLFLDSESNAAYPPYLTRAPEYGGVVPFRMGMGAGQVGFCEHPTMDFKQVDLRGPSDSLLGRMYPISARLADNRTGITPYTMGQTESTDPRSPARKTEILLGQSQLAIESVIDDWNIGWEMLAQHIWSSVKENAIIRGTEKIDGIVEGGGEILEGTAQITAEELEWNIAWISQASAGVVNPQARKTDFLQKFSFYIPLIQRLWQVNPELGIRYFVRWMRHSATELELRGARFLIPTEQELQGMPPDAMQGLLTEMQQWMGAGGREGIAPQPAEAELPEAAPAGAAAGGL